MAPASEVPSPASERPVPSAGVTPRRGKKLVRVRKDRPEAAAAAAPAPVDAPRVGTRFLPTARAAGAAYMLLLVLRLALTMAPGVIEAAEGADGADFLAATMLPGMAARTSPPSLPTGMVATTASAAVMHGGIGADGEVVVANYTRSVVGAFVTSGIPYGVVGAACARVPAIGRVLCAPSTVGYVAVYAPRLWMYALSLIGDVLLVYVFAVYNTEHAPAALLTYASSWMALLAMTRNTNFALEALCLLGLLAGCFGWTYQSPRPVFWLSATALALGVFLRPVFAVFICTPLIYLVSLWGKPGVDTLRYARAALEGVAIFAFWTSLWVSVDSVFYGTFALHFGDTKMESFHQFVENAFGDAAAAAAEPAPFNYKGYLLYVPLQACKGFFTRAFWTEILRNTSPGQMFIQLPVVLGPLMVMLIRESIDGMKLAIKELMGEIKTATGQKAKKRRKKTGMSKEREEEMLVYYDTIQTTLLLGLLMEVMQSHDRIGVMSLLALNAPAIICVAPTVFGPTSSLNVRLSHFAYTVAMIVFYGLLHQSGVARTLLAAGAGGVPAVPEASDLVVFRGHVHHPSSALGANVKGIRVHDGGNNRGDLMVKLRGLKEQPGYAEDRLLICAAATVPMKEEEFELVDTGAYGHMSVDDLPNNIDAFFTSNRLHVYKFIGDEDEAMMRDREEDEEEEERQREQKRSRKDR